MKNVIGLFPIALDIPKKEKALYYLNSNLKSAMTIFIITFLSFFSFSSFAIAQSESMDLFVVFKENPKQAKELKKEIKEEKENTKLVENISQTTMNKFEMNFPKAKDVAWSVPGNEFVRVNFIYKNKPRMAFYDFENNLIGTGHYTSYSSIPDKAQKRIAKEYKDYTPVKTMWFDDDESNQNNMDLLGIPVEDDGYFVQMKNGNKQIVLQVDTDGEVSYFSEMK
jgi:hypothetical protein